jgi:hypothetical protein
MVLAPLGWLVPPEAFEHLFHGFKGDLFPFTHVFKPSILKLSLMTKSVTFIFKHFGLLK